MLTANNWAYVVKQTDENIVGNRREIWASWDSGIYFISSQGVKV